MAAFGAKRTFGSPKRMTAFGGKAAIRHGPRHGSSVATENATERPGMERDGNGLATLRVPLTPNNQ